MLVEQKDDNDGEERITPVGSIVEVLHFLPSDRTFHVGCPITGATWFLSQTQFLTDTKDVEVPTNPFKNATTFSDALIMNRKSTLQLFVEKKVDELMQDGIRDVIGCLARWMLDGVNFGDHDTVCGLAESMLEEKEEENPDLLQCLANLLDCVERVDNGDDSAWPSRDLAIEEARELVAKMRGKAE